MRSPTRRPDTLAGLRSRLIVNRDRPRHPRAPAVRRPALLNRCSPSARHRRPDRLAPEVQEQLQDAGALETIAPLPRAARRAPSSSLPSTRRRRATPLRLRARCADNAARDVRSPRHARSGDGPRFRAWVESVPRARLERGAAGQLLARGPTKWTAWWMGLGRGRSSEDGPVSAPDLRGLAEFVRRHHGYRPLVLCDPSQRTAVRRLGLEALAWSDYLVSGPPRGS